MSNDDIVNIFNELADLRTNEPHAAKALRNVAGIVSRLKYEISVKNLDKVAQIRGVGKNSIERIREILRTGTLEELEALREAKESSSEEEIFDFTTIHGIGNAKAQRLIDAGYRTFEQLYEAWEEGDVNLTDAQEFGLENYEDLQYRVPRSEVERIGTVIIDEAHSISPNSILEIVGSYRRGAKTSGDIDILLTHPRDKNILQALITRLTDIGLIFKTLSLGPVKFMGAYMSNYQLPKSVGIVRKVDIRYVPYEDYPTALMHSTGSDRFNVQMREIARSKGLKLSEHGLVRRDNDKRILVESEQDIFDALGEEYLPPSER